MWLDDLEELVGKLRDRIYDHRSVLTRSESTTRYALIDPLLACLGWDLTDPGQVLTEYEARYEGNDKRHYADYVLFHGQRPCLVIEAKSLGTNLADGDKIDQGTKYCNRVGAQHFVLTNGDRWEARDRTDPRKPVFEFDITESRTNIIELLWLWPGNFHGERAKSIPKPRSNQPQAQMSTAPSHPSAQPPPGATSGVPLPNVGEEEGKPRRLSFPDGQTKEVSSGTSVQVATAEWLIDNGHVTSLPLQNERGKYLMCENQLPRFKKVREGYWIDTNLTIEQHRERAIELLKRCDVDPYAVHVEFS